MLLICLEQCVSLSKLFILLQICEVGKCPACPKYIIWNKPPDELVHDLLSDSSATHIIPHNFRRLVLTAQILSSGRDIIVQAAIGTYQGISQVSGCYDERKLAVCNPVVSFRAAARIQHHQLQVQKASSLLFPTKATA